MSRTPAPGGVPGCQEVLEGHTMRVWRSTWLRVKQGTENPSVPGWDFHSESGGEKEGLLPNPVLALGRCRSSFPAPSQSQAALHIWKKIKLGSGSACQPSSASLAAQGSGPGEVSMGGFCSPGPGGDAGGPGWARCRVWGWAGRAELCWAQGHGSVLLQHPGGHCPSSGLLVQSVTRPESPLGAAQLCWWSSQTLLSARALRCPAPSAPSETGTAGRGGRELGRGQVSPLNPLKP